MPSLNWIGKEAVVDYHRQVPYRLLRCHPELSAGDALAGNLLIEGDNLHALKALLPYYAGKVKCIYIDPPYNTGNEGWVYNDAVNAPEMKAWLADALAGQPVKVDDLSRHDKWLCMMHPRLVLLRELLTEDGSLWMSIDDNEVHHARLLLHEVFGERNFVTTVVWERSDSPRMDAQFFSIRHDYVLVAARDMEELVLHRIHPDDEKQPTHYDKIDAVGRPYYLKPLRAMGGQGDTRTARPTLYYALTAPDGSSVYPKRQDGSDGAWRWRREKVEDEADRIDWIIGRNGWTPYFRIYQESNAVRPPETIWYHPEVGSNRTSKAEIKRIFVETKAFDTPKPTGLIHRILQIATNPGDLVLDSFAGSGTTGHSVLKLNAEDGGNRRFILIEMEPKVAGPIAAERLRRVIGGYGDTPGLGGGFRFCTLDEPLFDERGRVRWGVTFGELARHIFFTETGRPLPAAPDGETPLIGEHDGIAYFLLWSGATAGVLDAAALRVLAKHEGRKVVYAELCRVSLQRLERAGITYKQIPYNIRTS
jgi:adenine-specific DNA-methyltransferase